MSESGSEVAKPTWMANRPSWPTAKKGANIPKDDATAKLNTSIRDLYVHHSTSETADTVTQRFVNACLQHSMHERHQIRHYSSDITHRFGTAQCWYSCRGMSHRSADPCSCRYLLRCATHQLNNLNLPDCDSWWVAHQCMCLQQPAAAAEVCKRSA